MFARRWKKELFVSTGIVLGDSITRNAVKFVGNGAITVISLDRVERLNIKNSKSLLALKKFLSQLTRGI